PTDGRVVVTDPGGNATTFDAAGNLSLIPPNLTITDPLGRKSYVQGSGLLPGTWQIDRAKISPYSYLYTLGFVDPDGRYVQKHFPHTGQFAKVWEGQGATAADRHVGSNAFEMTFASSPNALGPNTRRLVADQKSPAPFTYGGGIPTYTYEYDDQDRIVRVVE